MPVYRYQFCDLTTDTHITDLPLTGVRFDRRICQPGSISATIPVPNRTIADRAALVVPRAHDDITCGPGRTVLHVWRGDEIWGSYIIWSARVRSRRGQISIDLRGAGLESWLYRRRLLGSTYSQVDQLDIARDLVERADDDTPWGLGLITGGQASSGVLRDRTYEFTDFAMIGKRLEELSEVINGPEWYIRTYPEANGTRVREFYVAQVLGTGTVHRFTQPGNLLDWEYEIDATDAAIYHTVRGGGDGDGERWLSQRSSTPHFSARWPWLDAVHDYPTVRSLASGQEYADWWKEHRSGARRILSATVRPGDTPTLTPDHLGDIARLTVVNDWWPVDTNGEPTFDQVRRVVGLEVTPRERDTPEEMRLVFEEPRPDSAAADGYGTPQYPADVTAMLASLPAKLRDIISGSAPMP